jgi:hypothetical protein
LPIRRFCAGIAVLALLCGCSAVHDPGRLADSVRTQYADSAEIQTTVEIRADSGEECAEYTVQLDYQNGETPRAEITVQEPESIAGISAVYEADSRTLTYEDTVLQTLLPERGGLTPVDAGPAILYSLTTAEPTAVWTEEDLMVLQYREETEEGAVVQELYLNLSDGMLTAARVFFNETQIITCKFTQFQMS